jgi:type I restriction enzyme S subunit
MSYEEKRRLKQTRIGMIPVDWTICILAEHIEIIGGGTPKTTVKEYWNGEIPWISVVDFVGDRRWIYDTEKHITKKGLENSSTKLLHEGQLVISARGTVGELGQVTRDMAFNQSCYGIDGKGELDNNYLYYLLKQKVKEFRQKGHGAVFNTITRETFEHILIPKPEISEQQTIAKILSDLDSKIELNRKMNKTLEATGQAIFKRWFVDFEFPNEESKPYKSSGGEMIYNEELDREIPKGWSCKTLSELSINLDSQRVPLSSREREKMHGTYPYYGAAGILDYVNNYIFEGTCTLMGEDGSVIDEKGFPILQLVHGRFWANNHAHVLQGKGISTELLFLLLKNTNVQHIVTGAVQPKINQGNMNTLAFVIPDETCKNRLQKFVNQLYARTSINDEQNQTLSHIRDTLLPKLMSGKIKVPFSKEKMGAS